MSLRERIRAGEDPRSAVEHDLRAPLSVIAGYAELLRDRDDPGIRLEASQQLMAACERLSALVGEIAELVGAARAPVARRDRPAAQRRILIADDDAALRSLLRATLSPDAFQIAEAADGEEALELIAALPPDVLLLDWRMPGASGGEVLRRVAEEYPQVAVIVLTAERDPACRDEVAALGATFLTKPFSPTRLLRLLDELA